MNDACFRVAVDPAHYRPTMTNHFEVTVYDLDGMINEADPEKKPITDSMLTLKIANDTFQEPTLSQQSIQLKRGNMVLEFPGSIDASQSTATFQIMVNKSAYDILYSWKLASGNQEDGNVGDPQDYWKKVEVDVMTGNKGKLTGTWTLPYSWIQSLQGITFSNGANEIKACTITLKYFKPFWRSAVV